MKTEPKGTERGSTVVATLPGSFPLTDFGNAERLVASFRDRIRYCPPRRKWLVWDGRRWAWDETGEIVRFAKTTVRGVYDEASRCHDDELRKAIAKHARDSERAPRVAALIQLAQSEPGVAVMPNELDRNPWAFNVLNGTIDLRSGKLRAHDRRDLITRLAPVDFSADAKSELWERYLAESTAGDDDLAAYLRRATGYALQGTVTERAFWFLFGRPGSAKSTFIDAVGAAFGDYHASAAFETWLVQSSTGGNRGDLVRLAYARLVTSVEVRKGAKFDEAIIKAITGGDEITAAAKYENEVTFRPQFALWLAANDAPAIRDDDEGAWARVRRVPFAHVIPLDRQDRTLKERLREPAVRAAVLAWAVRGCLEWQRDGLGTCAAVERCTAEYRADMDRVAGFLEERCAFEPGASVPTSSLRQSYDEWCKENAVKPLAGKELAARLRERGCVDGKEGRGCRVWRGIRLLGAWETSGDRRDSNSRDFSHEKIIDQLPGAAVSAVSGACAVSVQADLFDEEREAIQAEGGAT